MSVTPTVLCGGLSSNRKSSPYVAHAIPAFIYGTAWKKEATADLVYQALSVGFTGIDTANQPKHYQEQMVGDGFRRALRDGKVERKDVYLQTKFTSVAGQDSKNIPYDPKDPISKQVQDSVESSLRHLRAAGHNFDDVEESYLDAVVLHSPMPSLSETMEVWQALEYFVPDRVRNLGISNCSLHTLMDIYERASIKPAIVQNRFYPATKFDTDLRKFCREKSIIYQSFWTLTANPSLVWSVEVGQLANRLNISPQAALYCLVLELGNTVVLNGTKQDQTMRADLKAVESVRQFSEAQSIDWKNMLQAFKKLVGDQ